MTDGDDSFSLRQVEHQKYCYQKKKGAVPQATSQSQKDLQTHVSTLCNIIKKFYSHKTINMPPGCSSKKKLCNWKSARAGMDCGKYTMKILNDLKHRSIDKRIVDGLLLASNESWPKSHCKPLEKYNELPPKKHFTLKHLNTTKRKYQETSRLKEVILFLCIEISVQIIVPGIHIFCDSKIKVNFFN